MLCFWYSTFSLRFYDFLNKYLFSLENPPPKRYTHSVFSFCKPMIINIFFFYIEETNMQPMPESTEVELPIPFIMFQSKAANLLGIKTSTFGKR